MTLRWLAVLRDRCGLLFRRAVAWPPPGCVRFGSLGRTTPISSRFGLDRGGPLDRVYVEEFLARQAADMRGAVLEFGDAGYTRRFGGATVGRSDVLHPRPGPGVTLVGDLETGTGLPAEAYDCIVCTQVLQFVFDLRAAVRNLHRMLRPGGVLLGTVPVVSMSSPTDGREFGEYWRITAQGMRRLLDEVFPAATVEVAAHGNVLAAVAFLHGLGRAEVPAADLARVEPLHEVLVTFRARRLA